MKKIIIALLFIPCLAFAQSSAVQVNSAGKIVVPANGTLNSPGTITAQNITSNGTATVGNLTTAGNITGATITSNGTITAGGTISPTSGMGLIPNIWPSSSYPSLMVYGNFGGVGTGVRFISDNQYVGVGNDVEGGGQVGLVFFTGGSPGTERARFTHGGTFVVKGGLQVGSSGTSQSAVYSASASINFANTTAQTTNSGNTITVTGASTTNTPSVEIGLSGAIPTGCSVHGIVTSANTVTLYFVNGSASAQDPAALTIRATVTQF